ncbi:MAG: M28 family peptidase, partial [Bacteroidota bacterium]|nr:M28 family peptidase [Bacteroidota bacterium]
EFKKIGLQYFDGLKSYRQSTAIYKPKIISVKGNIDGNEIDDKNVMVIGSAESITLNNNSGYEIATIPAGKDLRSEVSKITGSDKNYFVIVDTSYSARFIRFKKSNPAIFENKTSVFLLSASIPLKYDLQIKQEVSKLPLANVVGILPGNSKKDEYVIFSGHYDHLGIGKPDAKGDSIYNGANDDAAGTTAVIMLSKYFSQLKNNERTLIFVAFTGEEIGGYGSQYFSKQLNPDKVVAMFNIEMIGTESKWGTNSAYITGYERSDFGKILQANLTNSKFHFEPDPYPKQNLFYRSDNATLAALGVPAHTISTSKMEEPPNNEPNYHKQSDEIGTLDMNNMAEIIKAIAISSKTIVNGKDAPARVEKK